MTTMKDALRQIQEINHQWTPQEVAAQRAEQERIGGIALQHNIATQTQWDTFNQAPVSEEQTDTDDPRD